MCDLVLSEAKRNTLSFDYESCDFKGLIESLRDGQDR